MNNEIKNDMIGTTIIMAFAILLIFAITYVPAKAQGDDLGLWKQIQFDIDLEPRVSMAFYKEVHYLLGCENCLSVKCISEKFQDHEIAMAIVKRHEFLSHYDLRTIANKLNAQLYQNDDGRWNIINPKSEREE